MARAMRPRKEGVMETILLEFNWNWLMGSLILVLEGIDARGVIESW